MAMISAYEMALEVYSQKNKLNAFPVPHTFIPECLGNDSVSKCFEWAIENVPWELFFPPQHSYKQDELSLWVLPEATF